MGAVAAWAIAETDVEDDLYDQDIIDLDIRDNKVGFTLRDMFGNEQFRLLTPKQARELARDLNAAARAAGAKR